MKNRAFIFLSLVFFLFAFPSKSQSREQLVKNLKELSSAEMAGRKPGTPGHKLAQQYIISEYEKAGLEPWQQSFIQPFEILTGKSKMDGVNLLGMVPGKSDKMIVISAHYDHLGVRSGQVYFGADDNASGVAALIYIANYFKQIQPNHTLVFAAFDGEEYGLQGARYFVSDIDHQKIVLNINMDMISRSNRQEIYACGTSHYPHLKPSLLAVSNKHPAVKLKFGHDRKSSREQDWTYNSDQGEFHKHGIPFIYFGVEDHADYHRSTDTFDKIDTEFYANVVQLILDFVKETDNKNHQP